MWGTAINMGKILIQGGVIISTSHGGTIKTQCQYNKPSSAAMRAESNLGAMMEKIMECTTQFKADTGLTL